MRDFNNRDDAGGRKPMGFYSMFGGRSFFQRYGLPENIAVSGNRMVSEVGGRNRLEVEFGNMVLSTEWVFEFLRKPSLEDYVDGDEARVKVDFNLFELAGYVLSGDFERSCHEDGLELSELGRKPYLDNLERDLFSLLVELHLQNDLPFIRKSFPFVVCLTHDVDEIRKTYQYLTNFFRLVKSKRLKMALAELKFLFADTVTRHNPFWTFEVLMDEERRMGVRSTLFFLYETSEVEITNPASWKHFGRRYDFRDSGISSVMHELEQGGWEVGLHGSFNSFNHCDSLKAEKELLEQVVGKKVAGVRQHNLNLEIPESWMCQDSLGFEYDSSLGFRSREGVGYRWGTCLPFHPLNSSGEVMRLLEIPMTLMDVSLDKSNIGVNRKEIAGMIDEVSSLRGVFCILWHHVFFNSRDYPEWVELYRWIVRECRRKGGIFLTLREAAELWKQREQGRLWVRYDGYGGGKIRVGSEYPHLQIFTPGGDAYQRCSNVSCGDGSVLSLDRVKICNLRGFY